MQLQTFVGNLSGLGIRELALDLVIKLRRLPVFTLLVQIRSFIGLGGFRGGSNACLVDLHGVRQSGRSFGSLALRVVAPAKHREEDQQGYSAIDPNLMLMRKNSLSAVAQGLPDFVLF